MNHLKKLLMTLVVWMQILPLGSLGHRESKMLSTNQTYERQKGNSSMEDLLCNSFARLDIVLER